MTVKNLVGTLARTGASTARSVVRHPLGTASLAAGLVKGTAEVGIGLVRSTVSGDAHAPEAAESPENTAEPVAEPAAQTISHALTEPAAEVATAATVEEDPRDQIPGPDLATFEPPRPEDLPEPIVIEAEPVAEGEAFHTEPKAASRASAHGGPAGDREEIEGYVEEIDLGDPSDPSDPSVQGTPIPGPTADPLQE